MVIGIDPGLMTGVSLWDDEARDLHSTGQLPAAAAVSHVWSLLEHRQHRVIACERFDLTWQTIKATRQYDALHVAGALKFKCAQLGLTYVEYARSDAKRLITDDVLRRLEYHRPGHSHANDATRQVLMHLVRTDQAFARGLLGSTKSEEMR